LYYGIDNSMANIVLQANGLTKRYGSLTAVNGLTLDIYEDEIFGLLGPNGAGKTTAINMICGLLKPDAGHVTVLGKPIRGGDANVRARVGVCPQDIVLWKQLTCLEQLQFIGQMYGVLGQDARRRGERLLEELDLSEKRDKQARTLSGGMQRRLNLAMALVHDPEILVLDEPEAGLDPQSRVKVREFLQSLARKKTVILTTHNMDEADRVADRVAIIDHGELLVLNTPEELKKSVGQGDVLEVNIEGQSVDENEVRRALDFLDNRARIDVLPEMLAIHVLNVVGIVSEVLDALEGIGIKPGEVRLRANTLEDVFIQLTGRKLRE